MLPKEHNMTLRELMIERIFFNMDQETLFKMHMLDEDDLKQMSDLDFLEVYEEVIAWSAV